MEEKVQKDKGSLRDRGESLLGQIHDQTHSGRRNGDNGPLAKIVYPLVIQTIILVVPQGSANLLLHLVQRLLPSRDDPS